MTPIIPINVKLKKAIDDIIQRALAGWLDDYKYKPDDRRTFIRWGSVQKDIHKAIDRILKLNPPCP